MKRITINELKRIEIAEGLVIQGCGGDPDEWLNGINKTLTEAGVLLDGDTFDDAYIFDHNGLANILFNMEDVKLNVGKLAMWRLQTHGTFGGTWLSDYLPNYLDVEWDARELEAVGADAESEDVMIPSGDRENTDIRSSIRAYIENTRDGLEAELPGADKSELTYLAAKLGGLSEAERDTFYAVVESGRHCANIADVINVIENLDNFYLQPAFSPAMYGDFLLDMDKDNSAAVFSRLELSGYSDERELAQYILRLEASVDAESYGRAAAERENGVFTHYGYLTESNGFEEIYRGVQDIPAEYRVYPPADRTLPVRVQNTDLADLVIKMHALAGDYMSPAPHHIRMLSNGENADYLLMMTENTIFLYGAGECYLHQEEGCQNWLTNTSESKRAFAIYVRGHEDGRVFGDISEVDFVELRQDIVSHAIHCERVEVVLEDGAERVLSEMEWDCVSAEDRDKLREYTVIYNSGDIRDLNAHLLDMRHSRENEGHVMSPDEFLQRFSDGFMAAAENPQPDMLRVDRKAAWQMLARSDAPVYRLTSDGPVELKTFDILRSKGGSWSAEYREFAIKKEDREGFDEWADRAVCDAMRPIERGGPGKNKSRGEEH